MKDVIEEVSAGGVLIRENKGKKEALLIKVRFYGYELPKGHLENDETHAEAAARELCEETALKEKPVMVRELGNLDYSFRHDEKKIHKRVFYFLFSLPGNNPTFGKRPAEVKELRWITADELDKISLVNEELRTIIRAAFSDQ